MRSVCAERQDSPRPFAPRNDDDRGLTPPVRSEAYKARLLVLGQSLSYLRHLGKIGRLLGRALIQKPPSGAAPRHLWKRPNFRVRNEPVLRTPKIIAVRLGAFSYDVPVAENLEVQVIISLAIASPAVTANHGEPDGEEEGKRNRASDTEKAKAAGCLRRRAPPAPRNVRPGDVEEEAILGPAVTVPAEPDGRSLPQPLLEETGRKELFICSQQTACLWSRDRRRFNRTALQPPHVTHRSLRNSLRRHLRVGT